MGHDQPNYLPAPPLINVVAYIFRSSEKELRIRMVVSEQKT